MEIGSKLRSRRAELGLSRNQLAEKLRISPSAIANYENGISYPKPEILISLMGALNIDANYLFQDSITNHRAPSRNTESSLLRANAWYASSSAKNMSAAAPGSGWNFPAYNRAEGECTAVFFFGKARQQIKYV